MFQNNNSLDLYQLIQDCWQTEPTLRPSFENIITNLEQIVAKYSTTSILETSSDFQVESHNTTKEEKEGKQFKC